MRIAFVYDALYPYVRGGAERRYREIGRRLRDRHEVHFVSWQWWEGPPRLEVEGMTFHGVGRPPKLYGGDGKRTVREAVSFSARLMPVLMRNRWDVIDCSATPYLPLYGVWVATRFTRPRLVVTWHEFWGDHWHDYLRDRPAVAAVARALEHAGRWVGDELVAVSEFTARRMEPQRRPLRVVGNGVTVPSEGASYEVADPADLIFVGRLIDEKRVDRLLDAVRLLVARFPSVTCDIVGDGPEMAALRARSAELELGDRVRFHGALPDAEAEARLRAARILVLPSAREGFGMAVIEAQAHGTVPVVVRSPESAATELVRDGTDGLVCDESPQGIAEAAGTLLTDEAELARMAALARQSAGRRDWDHVARQMEEVYRRAPAGEATVAAEGSAPWS